MRSRCTDVGRAKRQDRRCGSFEGEPNVLEHRVIHINGGCLEFPANPERLILILVECGEVGVVAVSIFPRSGARAAGNEVEHRAFARAVRTDDGAQLALVHIKGEIVDRLEAVESFS